MKIRTLSKFLKVVIAFSLFQTPLTAHSAGSTCTIKKSCDKAYSESKVGANNDVTKLTAGGYGGGKQMQSESEKNAGLACGAQATCEKTKCVPDQNGCSKEDCKDVKGKIGTLAKACTGFTAAGIEAAQSANAAGGAAPQSTGLGDSMMPLLMGAAIGGLAAYMLLKKDDKKDDDSALLENGQIDCSKKDAYKYQGCNGFLEEQCKTGAETPACTGFRSRYCAGPAGGPPGVVTPMPGAGPGMGSGGGAPNVIQPEQAVATQSSNSQIVKGNPGEGIGSQFCKLSNAQGFCKTAGREKCPSCSQLANMNSPACQQNPALCMAQNSAEQIQQAKITCPTDPAFADPAFAAGGGAQIPTQLNQGGLPAVTLPGAGATAGTGAGVGAGAGAGQVPPTTLPAVQGSNAAREGYTNGTNSATGGAGGVNTGYSTASVSGSGARDVASVNGGRGPASDIQGKYGPSLFVVSAQVIRDKCSKGKFRNCP